MRNLKRIEYAIYPRVDRVSFSMDTCGFDFKKVCCLVMFPIRGIDGRNTPFGFLYFVCYARLFDEYRATGLTS